MAETEFIEQLRRDLPRLLREHPEVRHELGGIMLEAFPSRQEFLALLEEMRAFREDTNRRFEELRQDMNQRFEAIDRRFEVVIEELRSHGGQLTDLHREVRDVNIQIQQTLSRFGVYHASRPLTECRRCVCQATRMSPNVPGVYWR